MRWARAFGRFWWDFLIGDTPELTAAVALVLVVTAIAPSAAGLVVVPLGVLAALGLSLARAARRP